MGLMTPVRPVFRTGRAHWKGARLPERGFTAARFKSSSCAIRFVLS